MRVGWAAFILPFAFVSTPALLFVGPISETILAACLTAIGIAAVSAGIAGFWCRRLNVILRLTALALGALSLPLGFIDVALATHIFAAALALLLGLSLVVLKARSRADGQPT